MATDPGSVPPPLTGATPAKTSALAVTSLVLGILGLFTCGLTALVGLILGIVAIVKIKNSRGGLQGNGLAIAGIVVSGLFLLMLPIYAAMLLPALGAARQKAQEINCLNNEKELALAIQIYATDHTNHFPAARTWCDDIRDAVGNEKPFVCPAAAGKAAGQPSRCYYAFNAKLSGLDMDKVNPSTVLLFESDRGWNAAGGPELLPSPAFHGYTTRQVFVVTLADGTVERVKNQDLGSLRWDP